MKSIRTLGKTISKARVNNKLLGAELEDLARRATSKLLLGPDEEINLQVIDCINASAGEPHCAVQVATVLHKRLTQSNPQKQWLAVVLTKKVFEECGDKITPVMDEIMADLAKIAGAPMDRYQANIKAQQRAKSLAFAVLRSQGKAGQAILRHVAGLGKMTNLSPEKTSGSAPSSRQHGSSKDKADSEKDGATLNGHSSSNGMSKGHSKKSAPKSWPEVRDAVTSGISVASSHTSMVQDLCANLASGESAAPDFEAQFLDELVGEMRSFRDAFEQLLGATAAYTTPEATALLSQALEAREAINTALQLHADVRGQGSGSSSPCSNSSKGKQREVAGSGLAPIRVTAQRTRSGGSSASSRRAATAPAAAAKGPLAQWAPAAAAAPSSAAAASSHNSSINSLLDLHDALPRTSSAPLAAAAVPAQDPFAASHVFIPQPHPQPPQQMAMVPAGYMHPQHLQPDPAFFSQVPYQQMAPMGYYAAPGMNGIQYQHPNGYYGVPLPAAHVAYAVPSVKGDAAKPPAAVVAASPLAAPAVIDVGNPFSAEKAFGAAPAAVPDVNAQWETFSEQFQNTRAAEQNNIRPSHQHGVSIGADQVFDDLVAA